MMEVFIYPFLHLIITLIRINTLNLRAQAMIILRGTCVLSLIYWEEQILLKHSRFGNIQEVGC